MEHPNYRKPNGNMIIGSLQIRPAQFEAESAEIEDSVTESRLQG
jgi:hypothetical protein